MNSFKVLQRLVGMLLIALVVTGCSSAAGSPPSAAAGATPPASPSTALPTASPATATVSPVAATETASPSIALSASQAEQITTYLEKLSTADLFSGAVLVAKDGVPIFRRAYGLADKDANLPNQLDTKFNLGSLNKTFTAVAIAQLAEQGKLAFTDPIRTHLPAYPNQEVADTVTIHHLLTHTSGLGDFFDPNYDNKDNRCCVADYIPLFADAPLAFAPGEGHKYSNAGFIVLGAIIEQVSGQDYFDYVRQHIYAPVGMTNTDSYERDEKVANRAIGYQGLSHTLKNTGRLLMKGGPDGGGYSTVEDLLKFDRALRTHQLLSPETTERVMRGTADSNFPPDTKAAYALVDEQQNGRRLVWNGGRVEGANTKFVMHITSGHTVIVLSNYDPPAAELVADQLGEIIQED